LQIVADLTIIDLLLSQRQPIYLWSISITLGLVAWKNDGVGFSELGRELSPDSESLLIFSDIGN
jgi:hypothetical protein